MSTAAVSSRWRRRSLRYLWCLWLGACGWLHDDAAHDGILGHDAAVTLRFKPAPGQHWREHWVYDLDAPGAGLLRSALSLDVTAGHSEANTLPLRYSVRKQFHGRDGKPETLGDLGGTQISAHWGQDRSLFGDFAVVARSAEAASVVRELVLAVRFGLLIEYPDQAISVADSWSIEPRTLSVGPGLSAVLRPSYALESLSEKHGVIEARIGTDIQVDLIPQQLGDGVMVEGGGTASGSLRVRASDGVLLEARTILHFNQEVRLQGTETLGYREFAATAHVFVTPDSVQPDLAAELSKIEPTDADEVGACVGLLDAVAERVGHAPAPLRPYILGALSAEALPIVTAPAAAPIREPGSTLLIAADGKRVELDGLSLDAKELPRAIRNSAVSFDPLYVLAPVNLTVERLRATLALLPRRTVVRLLVRAANHETTLPKATRFVEEQLRAALAADPIERQTRLSQLLVDHLVLCEGALAAYRRLEKTKLGVAEGPSQILRAVAQCGCTTTQVDGLELSLQALFGSVELRALRWPLRSSELHAASVSGTASVQALVRGVGDSASR